MYPFFFLFDIDAKRKKNRYLKKKENHSCYAQCTFDLLRKSIKLFFLEILNKKITIAAYAEVIDIF